jgi:hypothetical protein
VQYFKSFLFIQLLLCDSFLSKYFIDEKEQVRLIDTLLFEDIED